MSAITGTVVLTGAISPSDTLDTYFVTDPQWGLGSAREVDTVATRNSIYTQRRTFGMIVTVNADGTPANNKTYMLANVALGGVNNTLSDNSNWIDFSTGGSTPITLNVISKGTGTSITDGTWAFSGNTIYPLTDISNIGIPESLGANIITNSGFTGGTTGWAIGGASVYPPSGYYYNTNKVSFYGVISTAVTSYIEQDVTASLTGTPTVYTISVTVANITGTSTIVPIAIDINGIEVILLSATTNGTHTVNTPAIDNSLTTKIRIGSASPIVIPFVGVDWQFDVDDVLLQPMVAGNRVGTVYMASTFDYASNLLFKENGAERMRITTGGNLAIGTTSSTSRLKVRSVGTSDNTILDNTTYSLTINPEGLSTLTEFISTNIGFQFTSASGLFRFQRASSGVQTIYVNNNITQLKFTADQTSANNQLILDGSPNYYIGIGTATPLSPLNVEASIGGTNNYMLTLTNNNNIVGEFTGIKLNAPFATVGGAGFGFVKMGSQAGAGTFDIGSTTNWHDDFYTGNVLRVRIHGTTGFVGIGTGTTPPSASLQVQGSGVTSATYTAKFHNSNGTSNSLGIQDDSVIGIGVANPQHRLHIKSDSNNAIGFSISGGNVNRMKMFLGDGTSGFNAEEFYFVGNNSYFHFIPNAIEFFTITSNGVGVNNTTPSINTFNVGFNQVISIGGSNPLLRLVNTTSANSMISFDVNGGSGNRGKIYVDGINEFLNLSALNSSILFYTGSAGATERMRITQSGLIGIGVIPSSGNRLEVNGIGITSATYTAQFHNSTGTSNSLVITDDGKVGIGTSTPNNALLNIVAPNDSPFALSIRNTTYSGSDTNAFRLYQSNTGTVNISNGGNNFWTITATNNSTFQSFSTDVAIRAIGFDSLNTSVAFLARGSGGSDYGLFVTNAGNVTIGSGTNPVGRLDVYGAGTTSATYATRIYDSASTIILSVQDNGRIGIGKSAPAAYLDILFNTTDINDNGLRLKNSNAGSGSTTSLFFDTNALTGYNIIYANSSTNSTRGQPNSLSYYSKNHSFLESTANNNVMLVTYDTGTTEARVAVGKNFITPKVELDVFGMIQWTPPRGDQPFSTNSTIGASTIKGGAFSNSTSSSITLTMPTGTNLGAELGATPGTTFSFVVFTTLAGGDIVLATNTGAVQSPFAVAGELTITGTTTAGVSHWEITFITATSYTFKRIS